MKEFDRFTASWFVTFAALLSYWEIAEELHPGREYASPYLPCATVATMLGPLVFITWMVIHHKPWRQRRISRGSELVTLDGEGGHRIVNLPADAVVLIGGTCFHIPAGQTRAVLAPGHRYELVDWADRAR